MIWRKGAENTLKHKNMNIIKKIKDLFYKNKSVYKEVNISIVLPNNSLYTGKARFYESHNSKSKNKEGIIAIFKQGEFIFLSRMIDGNINGWAIFLLHHENYIGEYRNNIFYRITTLPFIDDLWTKIISYDYDDDLGSVVTKYEDGTFDLFYGAFANIFHPRMGLHYCDNGVMYIGIHDEGRRLITGHFLQFNCNKDVVCGKFKDGKLIDYSDAEEMLDILEDYSI